MVFDAADARRSLVRGGRVALLGALLALASWLWVRHALHLAAVLAGLAALAVAWSIGWAARRDERALIQLLEVWAAGEQAAPPRRLGLRAVKPVAQVNARLLEPQRRLLTQVHSLQLLLDHAPAPLLRVVPGVPGEPTRCEALNRAGRKLLTALGAGDRPAIDALGADAARLLRGAEVTRRPGAAGDGVPGVESIEIRGLARRYVVSVAEFGVAPQTHRIAALQDVQAAIDQTELQAWRDLTRVLTHEIMNGLVPITSLAEAALRELAAADASADASRAVGALARRARDLHAFIDAYRSLTRPLSVRLVPLDAALLLDDLLDSLRAEWGNRVRFTLDGPTSGTAVLADPVLLQQALFNVARNAAQAALDRHGEDARAAVRLHWSTDADGGTRIEVCDNGAGIPVSQRDQVFLPFFTTRSDGQGVGLSLSRQIMMAHGGGMAILEPTHGDGARVMLSLPGPAPSG